MNLKMKSIFCFVFIDLILTFRKTVLVASWLLQAHLIMNYEMFAFEYAALWKLFEFLFERLKNRCWWLWRLLLLIQNRTLIVESKSRPESFWLSLCIIQHRTKCNSHLIYEFVRASSKQNNLALLESYQLLIHNCFDDRIERV